MDKGRSEYVNGLRELATFLERNEGVPLPETFVRSFAPIEDLRNLVRAGGLVEKTYGTSTVGVERRFGNITVSWQTGRDAVCEKVLVGYRTEKQKPKRRRAVYKWTCGSIMGGKNGVA